MLKLVSFHIQAQLNAFLQILEYFSQICFGPLARELPCSLEIQNTPENPDNCGVQYSDKRNAVWIERFNLKQEKSLGLLNEARCKGKGKGKSRPATGLEGPEGE